MWMKSRVRMRKNGPTADNRLRHQIRDSLIAAETSIVRTTKERASYVIAKFFKE